MFGTVYAKQDRPQSRSSLTCVDGSVDCSSGPGTNDSRHFEYHCTTETFNASWRVDGNRKRKFARSGRPSRIIGVWQPFSSQMLVETRAVPYPSCRPVPVASKWPSQWRCSSETATTPSPSCFTCDRWCGPLRRAGHRARYPERRRAVRLRPAGLLAPHCWF